MSSLWLHKAAKSREELPDLQRELSSELRDSVSHHLRRTSLKAHLYWLDQMTKKTCFDFLAHHLRRTALKAFFGNLQHSVMLCGIQSARNGGKTRPDSLQFKSSLWKHIEDLLGKDCGPNRKSRKVGLEIINVEAQIIMPSGTPGSQPWIYMIFTAFSLPSIGSESPGFSKERLMMRGCASISRQATLLS